MGRPAHTIDNSFVAEELSYYFRMQDAIEDHPALGDVLHGVAHLDYDGNTRPLSISTLFVLLSTLPVISTKAIQDATKYSLSHSKRLNTAVSIASRAIFDYWAKTKLSV